MFKDENGVLLQLASGVLQHFGFLGTAEKLGCGGCGFGVLNTMTVAIETSSALSAARRAIYACMYIYMYTYIYIYTYTLYLYIYTKKLEGTRVFLLLSLVVIVQG